MLKYFLSKRHLLTLCSVDKTLGRRRAEARGRGASSPASPCPRSGASPPGPYDRAGDRTARRVSQPAMQVFGASATRRRGPMVLVESLAHVFSTGKSANDLANPPTGHGGFATPETFQLKEILDDRRICQVRISDLANPRGPENMGERFDQDHNTSMHWKPKIDTQDCTANESRTRSN